MQMIMTTLHIEVMIRSTTSALTAAPHLLVLVKTENLEDVDIVMMGINAVVDAALHLEAVTTDCRDINAQFHRNGLRSGGNVRSRQGQHEDKHDDDDSDSDSESDSDYGTTSHIK